MNFKRFRIQWVFICILFALTRAVCVNGKELFHKERKPISQVTSQAHPELSLPRLDNERVKWAELEFLAELAGLYPDREIYVLARGMERIYDLAEMMGIKNVHLINVSRESISDQNSGDYIRQQLPGIEELEGGKKVLFADNGWKGGLVDAIRSKFPSHVQNQFQAHFVGSKVPGDRSLKIPSSRVFLSTLEPEFLSEKTKIRPDQMGTVVRWYAGDAFGVPKEFNQANGYVLQDGKWDAESSNRTDKTKKKALAFREDLKFFAQRPEVKEHFQKRLKTWKDFHGFIEKLPKNTDGSLKSPGREDLVRYLNSMITGVPRDPVEEAIVRDAVDAINKNFSELKANIQIDPKSESEVRLPVTFDMAVSRGSELEFMVLDHMSLPEARSDRSAMSVRQRKMAIDEMARRFFGSQDTYEQLQRVHDFYQSSSDPELRDLAEYALVKRMGAFDRLVQVSSQKHERLFSSLLNDREESISLRATKELQKLEQLTPESLNRISLALTNPIDWTRIDQREVLVDLVLKHVSKGAQLGLKSSLAEVVLHADPITRSVVQRDLSQLFRNSSKQESSGTSGEQVPSTDVSTPIAGDSAESVPSPNASSSQRVKNATVEQIKDMKVSELLDELARNIQNKNADLKLISTIIDRLEKTPPRRPLDLARLAEVMAMPETHLLNYYPNVLFKVLYDNLFDLPNRTIRDALRDTLPEALRRISKALESEALKDPRFQKKTGELLGKVNNLLETCILGLAQTIGK